MNEKDDDIAHPARSETSISASMVLVDDEVQILLDAWLWFVDTRLRIRVQPPAAPD